MILLFSQLCGDSIHSVNLGPLRFPRSMFEQVAKLYPKEKLFATDFYYGKSMVSYSPEIEEEMYAYCKNILAQYMDEARFFTCDPRGKEHFDNLQLKKKGAA